MKQNLNIKQTYPMLLFIILGLSACIKDKKDFGDWAQIDDFSYVSDLLVIDTTLYVSGLHGIAASTNTGINFSLLNNGLDEVLNSENNQILSIAGISVNGAHHLFAGTYDHGVYVSTDGGNQWFQSNNGLTSLRIVNVEAGNGLVFAVAQATFSGGGTFRSTNQGLTWEKIEGVESPLEPGVKYAVEYFHVNTPLLFGGAGSGVYVSSDQGLTWSETARILIGQSFLTRDGSLYVGTGGNGIFMTTNQGTFWTRVTPEFGEPSHVIALASADEVLFAGTGVLYASQDGGQTWSNISKKLHEGEAISFLTGVAVLQKVVFVSISGGTFKDGLWMNRKYLSQDE